MEKVKTVYQYKVKYEPICEASTHVKTSNAAHDALRAVWEDINDIEKFYIVTLNRANKVTGVNLISIGGMASTTADGKIIFRNALLNNAAGIILAHNHPSGQLIPSTQDERLTEKLVSFGALIDCPVLDHLILVPEGGFYSFADAGKI
jgi:DNA repair protein RadC